jgi:dihydroxy-acid dehydratase
MQMCSTGDGRAETPSLRSGRWYGVPTFRAFGHRSRTLQLGFDRIDFEGKPVIAVINTWSEINHCHSHFPERAQAIKRGIWQAGGFALEMPALSLAEVMQKPTSMLYRNLLALEVEEILRSYPFDGAVLMCGCDKTVPGLVLGAISADLPAIVFPAGPMLAAHWRGEVLGSGSDVFKYWDRLRADEIDESEWRELESSIARSAGHCMTMGTASTMTAAVEALGLTLPGVSSIPAPDSAHTRAAVATGRRIVEMVREDVRPSTILSRRAFDNAIVCVAALGGSTNAIIHLIAMARRAGVDLDLAAFDTVAAPVPVLANIRPSGKYLMEDFAYAGGLPALLAVLEDFLVLDELTVNGRTLRENVREAQVFNNDVIRLPHRPASAGAGLAVLRGTLAPDGAVIKSSAASPDLLQHTGRAFVFRDYDELEHRLANESDEISADSVLVLQNAGPLGGPGMPEWGQLPIPPRLLRAGIRDIVRVSDARMSGTSYGTCVLHVAPEAFIGGPLALVRDGDLIELDVPRRQLNVLVGEEELARRRAEWTPPEPRYARGYGLLAARAMQQADVGCDFDFLERAAPTPEPAIH